MVFREIPEQRRRHFLGEKNRTQTSTKNFIFYFIRPYGTCICLFILNVSNEIHMCTQYVTHHLKCLKSKYPAEFGKIKKKSF